jgi:hypothetical protein|tara:strand:- start:991 stop:1332 length:342 start_codon:yes stop_codon:yes gene_type:complete
MKNKKFEDVLEEINFANPNQVKKELWNVEGVLRGRLNQKFKFDTRPILKLKDGQVGKQGSFVTKADKVVFEYKNKWVIVDIEELHKYIKDNKRTTVEVKELLDKLEWNIVLDK